MSNGPVFRPQFPPNTDPQSPAPYRFEGVSFRVFPLRAQAAPLAALCDQQLNSVAQELGYDSRWEPLMGLDGHCIVYLELVSYARIYSTAPGGRDMGYSSQDELAFLVPLVERDSAGHLIGLSSFVPYCAVDDDWSEITGRQVLGYPKVRGRFELPGQPNEVGPIRVEVTALRQYSPNTKSEFLPVVELPLTGPPPPPPDVIGKPEELWPLGPVEALYGYDGVRLAPDLYDMLQAYLGVSIPGVALKQSRDVPSPAEACFQALTGFEIKVLETVAAGMLPPVPVELHDYASLPLRATLGLPASGALTPLFPFWYEATLELDDASCLAVRCADKSPASPGRPQPPAGGGTCWELLRKAGAMCTAEAEAQASQWREATERLGQGGYGPLEAGQDLQEACRRNLELGSELGRLWWDGVRHCGEEMAGRLTRAPAGASTGATAAGPAGLRTGARPFTAGWPWL